jgi:hypothetical protein
MCNHKDNNLFFQSFLNQCSDQLFGLDKVFPLLLLYQVLEVSRSGVEK